MLRKPHFHVRSDVSQVVCCCFSHDGSLVLSGSIDHTLQLFQLVTTAPVTHAQSSTPFPSSHSHSITTVPSTSLPSPIPLAASPVCASSTPSVPSIVEVTPSCDELDSLTYVEYVGILRLTTGFVPPMSCKTHMLSDLPSIFPAVTQLEIIVEESEQITQNRLSCIPAGVPVLTPDQAIAICAYTFDLGFNSHTTDGSDNLFVQLNQTLRTRDTTKMMALRPYLYFLMSGLAALPDWKGIVFRGVPASSFSVVKDNYSNGKDIHWSSFTSTTTSISRAKQFAHGKGGIIFSIHVLTGRNVSSYSAFKRENEILLGPNTRLMVTSDLVLNSEGMFDISLHQRVGQAFIF